MKRLTAYDGNYYYPHCMRGSTCDGRGPSEKCKECEFDDRICVTIGKYEDTGLTPQEIMELKERDTAKAPEEFDGHWYKCPRCGKYVGGLKGSFCHVCGQRLNKED